VKLYLKSKQKKLVFDNKEILVQYTISKRKSIVIRIVSKDSIEIKAPYFMSEKNINKYIKKKSDWIKKHCENILENDRSSLFYLGKAYTIKKSDIVDIEILNNYIIIPYNYCDNDIYNWYKSQTKIHVNKLYKNMTFERIPNKIIIKKQKKRWGTCTSKGNIYINGLLSMCKSEAIEYIIYHELCHLVYMNHSKDFYNLLEKYCKNYKNMKKWLKENQHNIVIDVCK